MLRIILFLAFILSALPAQAQTIDIDISQAKRLLEISCSNEKYDPMEFSQSPIVKKQIAHHAAFAKRFSMENYLKGLSAAANCEVLQSDPFRFKYLVEQRPLMEKSITYLLSKRTDLTRRIQGNISPYLPDGFVFQSQVIISAASFSCGGFAKDELFYIDLPCLTADIEGEYEAISKLISHEAYHAMQNEFASKPMVEEENVQTKLQAWDYMFHRLAMEGSAAFIGDMRNIKGNGRYAKFSRNLAQRNFRQLSYNFDLLAFMMEAVAHDPDSLAERFPKIYALAFDGGFGEPSYFTGQQMTAEIVHSFGPKSLPCLLALPPEEFTLGYNAALADGDNLKQSEALAPAIVDFAHQLKASRHQPVNSCISAPAS